MVLQEFDNVKAEKAIAMRKFNRQRKVKLMFELCVAAFLVSQSSSWFPVVTSFLGETLRLVIAFLNRPFYVFMLFNLMIFVIYALSGRDQKHDGKNKAETTDLHDEIVGTFTGDSLETVNTPVESFYDKQIECSEKANPSTHECTETVECSENATSPIHQRTETVVCSEIATLPIHERTLNVVHGTKEPVLSQVFKNANPVTTSINSETKLYRRTQSDSYNSRKIKKSGRELRRSETFFEMVRSGSERSRRSSSVEEMNDVEFNRAIEAFIAAQKWIHREEQKAEHLDLTLRY